MKIINSTIIIVLISLLITEFIQKDLNIYENSLCKEFSIVIFNKFNEAVHKEITEISNEIISYYLNLQYSKSVIDMCDKKIIGDMFLKLIII